MECERCHTCHNLEEVDSMIVTDSSDGMFMFCSIECSEDYEEEECKKHDALVSGDEQ